MKTMSKDSASTPDGLPETICVLDIETSETDFKNKSQCVVAVVGVKVYLRVGASYEPDEYRFYLADEMDGLAAFLSHFPGLIIGHNILDFDFGVLRSHVPLEGIIEKTTDTLLFLYRLNGRKLGGLKLDDLCKQNFGTGKTLMGASVPEMWRQGRRAEVIIYNETDCDLTQRLWWQLVSGRSVELPPLKNGRRRTLGVSDADMDALLCSKPLLRYPEWLRRQVKDQRLITFAARRWEAEDSAECFDFDLHESQQVMYGHAMFYCAKCDATSLFEGTVIGGCSADEAAHCPRCGEKLGEMREDERSAPECLGTLDGNFGSGISMGMVPEGFEKMMADHIRANRPTWTEDSEPVGDQCHICGKTPDLESPFKTPFFKNEVDGTPICGECVSACRWLLSLK